jgi:cell division protein FtsQ
MGPCIRDNREGRRRAKDRPDGTAAERTGPRGGGVSSKRLRDGSVLLLRRCGWPVLILLMIPCVGELVRTLERSPLFALREVQIEGCQRTTPEAVRSLIGAPEGRSLLLLDGGRISRILEGHVPILNASVIKRFPHRLLIRIRERTPVALVQIREHLYYLDGEGVVLYRTRPGDPLDFPMITGLADRSWQTGRPDQGRMVQEALSLLRVLNESPLPGGVSEIHVDPSEGLCFFLEGFPVEVRVGWEEFRPRIDRLQKVLAHLAGDPGGVVSIDLRFRDQVIVRKPENVPKQISARDPAGEKRALKRIVCKEGPFPSA